MLPVLVIDFRHQQLSHLVELIPLFQLKLPVQLYRDGAVGVASGSEYIFLHGYYVWVGKIKELIRIIFPPIKINKAGSGGCVAEAPSNWEGGWNIELNNLNCLF